MGKGFGFTVVAVLLAASGSAWASPGSACAQYTGEILPAGKFVPGRTGADDNIDEQGGPRVFFIANANCTNVRMVAIYHAPAGKIQMPTDGQCESTKFDHALGGTGPTHHSDDVCMDFPLNRRPGPLPYGKIDPKGLTLNSNNTQGAPESIQLFHRGSMMWSTFTFWPKKPVAAKPAPAPGHPSTPDNVAPADAPEGVAPASP